MEVPSNPAWGLQDSAQWFSGAGHASEGGFEKSDVSRTPSWPSPGPPWPCRGHSAVRRPRGRPGARALRPLLCERSVTRSS